jgi:hypothetical protein
MMHRIRNESRVIMQRNPLDPMMKAGAAVPHSKPGLDSTLGRTEVGT